VLKRCFVFVIFLLSLTFVFAGCNSSDTKESETASTTNDATNDVDATDTYTDTYTDTDTDTSVPEWKSAYLKVIEEDINHEGYALVFIDNDDIPELYMSGDCEATGDIVYSFKNGEIFEQGLHRIGGGRYLERSGLFANNNGHQGLTYTDVYNLTDSGFVKTFEALRIQKVSEYLGGEQYEFYIEYYVNDVLVDEIEYEDAKNNAFDFDSAVRFSDLEVSYEEIIKQINEF
jgi:hypothetical protein